MKVKVKMVVVAVLASLSSGVSVAHAGFSETPYISYLSAEEFDAVALPTAVTQAYTVSVNATRTAEIKQQRTVASSESKPATPGALATICAAEEIGYYAPCI